MGFTGATLTVLALDLAAPPTNKAARLPRAVLIGVPAVLALAALVIVAVIGLRQPKANEHAQAPSTEAPADHHPPDAGRPAPPWTTSGSSRRYSPRLQRRR
jgi:hypothetical protein